MSIDTLYYSTIFPFLLLVSSHRSYCFLLGIGVNSIQWIPAFCHGLGSTKVGPSHGVLYKNLVVVFIE